MVEKKQDKAATASLERRSEARIKACHPALLRTPNAHPIEGWLLDASSTGIGLRVPEPVPVGVAVRVDAQELLLFGTVTHCEQTDGAYRVGIKLSRSLEMLAELQKLNESIFIEPEAAKD
jgi:hypothetical protein